MVRNLKPLPIANELSVAIGQMYNISGKVFRIDAFALEMPSKEHTIRWTESGPEVQEPISGHPDTLLIRFTEVCK